MSPASVRWIESRAGGKSALEKLANPSDRDHRLTAADGCCIHQLWLGQIYPWAGKYRQDNLKKG